ncbi:MAG TPA: hypothetical protein VGQ67_01720, partial [Candidatus Polarisedimenticolia bacterium]|nr:hypothetical protein [Candidatus Polarisedimenticolia bacterium]
MQDDRLLNLSYWADLASRRRRLIVACTAGVFLSATAFSLSRPRIYEAISTLFLTGQRVQAIDFQDLYTKQQGGARPNELMMAQLEILRSMSVKELAVRELESRGLLDFNKADPAAGPGLLGNMMILAHLRDPEPVPTPEERRRSYVKDLGDRMTATTKGGNAFLAVAVTSRSPQMAAELANALTAAYLKHTRELVRRSADDAVEWLSGKLREQRDKLLDSENSLRAFSGPAPQADEMSQLTMQEMSRLQAA